MACCVSITQYHTGYAITAHYLAQASETQLRSDKFSVQLIGVSKQCECASSYYVQTCHCSFNRPTHMVIIKEEEEKKKKTKQCFWKPLEVLQHERFYQGRLNLMIFTVINHVSSV